MPSRPLAALLCAVAAMALVAGCTSGKTPSRPKTTAVTKTVTTTATTSGGPTVDPIQFVNCTSQIQPSLAKADQNRVSRLSFLCGRLNVPLNYADPHGPTTQIYVIRVHDNSQVKNSGSLLVNPGGPASSGVGLVIDLSTTVSDDLLAHFDLVGFDPRGVFLSSALSCSTDATKDAIVGLQADVRTTAGFTRASRTYASVGTACAKKYGTNLRYFNTVNDARDMDLVRQGVKDTKLNFYGTGYGTLLGATYAHLFPRTVRSIVLDGGVDPQLSPVARAQVRAAGLERNLTQFATACQARTDCKSLGVVRTTVRTLVRTMTARPLSPASSSDTRKITGQYVLAAAQIALTDRTKWNALRLALIAARTGDPSGLLGLVDAANQRDNTGHYTTLLDARTVQTCNDQAAAPTPAQVRTAAKSWVSRYPVFGLSAAAGLLQCASWPVPRTPIPAVTATTAPPVLLIGTVYDPVTPFTQTTSLATELGVGRVLTWQGTVHGAFLRTKCIRTAVDAYLINATVPAVDATCPAS